MSGRLSTLGAAALVAALALCSCAPPDPRPRDILLISIDTLRFDHLGLYGYPRETSPNLERWMADGAIFEHAYSTEAKTSPSVVSMLSGVLPQQHGVRLFYQLLPDGVKLITDLLPAEYQTAAFVSNMVLTDEAIGLAPRFAHYDDFVDERESERDVFERSARRTTDAALRWLREQRDETRPLFLWMHYNDPHGPYAPPDDAPVGFDHPEPLPIEFDRVKKYMRLPGVTDGREYVDRYDEEIAYMDQHLGRLLEGYAENHPVDDALLIFTADHGESMMDHEKWFRHGYHVYDEIVRVPLMLRAPGVEPGTRDTLATIIDIAPTVLGFAGAAIPDALGGVDLLADAAAADRIVFTEATAFKGHWKAIVRRGEKWMARMEQGRHAIVERRYYDLRADPDEQRPREWSDDDPDVAELLELCRSEPDPGGRPAEFAAGTNTGAPKVDPRAGPEAIERLRSLGYVE